jgi:hypothetical protein
MRFTISVEQRIQQLTQGAATAENSRFHSSHRHFEYLGDFFVLESLKIAQNHGAPKDVGDRLQRAPNRQLCLTGR